MKIAGWLFLAFFAFGTASAYEFGDGVIDIPDGFDGPVTQSLGQNATTAAFSYPHSEGNGTLLQITVWDPGQSFPEMNDAELRAGAKQYLLQFLGGVEGRREGFERQEVEFVRVAGYPAAKAAWRGSLQGEDMHGVMYCLVVNSKIYTFHTQDFVSMGERYTARAIKAFEAVTFDR